MVLSGGIMNNYIFDWEGNCKKVLQTKKYTTKKDIIYEQIMLVRYLRDKGFSYNSIYDIWVETMNGSPLILYDLKGEILSYFDKIYKKSDNLSISSGNIILIYKSEIDYINNIQCHMWIKEYLLILLCIYKYYGLEWCKYDDRIKTFCYSCTSIKREREKNTKSLAYVVEKYDLYKVIKSGCVRLKVNFSTDCGEVCAILKDPRDFESLKGKLKTESVCSICGKNFVFSSKKRRLDMCQDCIKKERSKDRHKSR